MRGLPEELFFLIILALIWLAPFLRQWLRRRQAPAASEAERAAEAVMADDDEPRRPPPPAPMPRQADAPRRTVPLRDRPAAALTLPARPITRRYSRAALMGNRRAAQNAFVMAAILQPCRARKPYGQE